MTRCRLLDGFDTTRVVNMSKLAKKAFTVPASSVVVNRRFNSAGIVIFQKRKTIISYTVNDITCSIDCQSFKVKHMNLSGNIFNCQIDSAFEVNA
jgi:hypothetical protein